MKRTKKSLFVSGVSLVISAVLLLGTTFAWFTDSVTNKGNVITSGELLINAYAYDLGQEGQSVTIQGVNNDQAFTFEKVPQDLKAANCPQIISEDLWEPGKTSAKLLEVKNDGTLATKIKVQFNVTETELMNALWFDFVKIEDGQVVGSFQKRPMSTLSTFAKDLEFSLLSGENVQFVLVYGMNENAGNEYQGTTFSADVSVIAAQYTYESDGFENNDYDQAATYDATAVTSEQEFLTAVENGQDIFLTNSIALNDSVSVDKDITLYLNGNDLTISNGKGALRVMKALTVEGNGTIKGALVANQNAKLTINGGKDFEVSSDFFIVAAISGALNSIVEIDGGTYTSTLKGSAVISFLGQELTVKNAVVNVGVDSASQSCGINSANAETTLLENVTVNAKYSVAVKLNNGMSGDATIINGTFTTDQAAEGFNPNPTIQYGGTLNISNAIVNRIGVGIYYRKSWPLPTEVVGLTMENVTFNAVNDNASEYQDVDYYRF